MPLCPWEPAQYLFFSSNVPPLFYYSHGISIIFALVFGFLLFFKAKKILSVKLLFIITLLFSSWALLDLYIWATNNPSDVLFYWSIIILIEVLIYIFSIYFVDVFNGKKDISFRKKLLMFFLVLPIVIGLPTYFNLTGIDMSSCVALEGFIATYYIYSVEFFCIMWILFYSFRLYGKTIDPGVKKQIVFSTTGIIFFLLALSSGNLIGSLTEQWQYSQYGLFAMPVFIGILTYLVVKYNSFNVKLIAAQALVWGLAILIGAQFFFIKILINFVLTGITFVASIIFGYLLIKSVTKEIQQKEQLAKLNIDLENLIKQRESLMHLITHKIKGSFTHSKYIFAGILDGTFGAITPDLQKMAEKGLESDNVGINTIDLILNTGNMQKGLIKYDMKKVDFKEIILNSLSEKKVSAEARGLQVEKEIGEDDYSVLGDAFWLKEAVNNFIENSIKYTKVGKIIIGLEKKNDRILFSVKDTGVGITEEDKKNLFTEGGRGKESVKVNVDSTGYGLFTVKLIIEAHKGRVSAESEGPGKGSQFYIELPRA